MLSIIIQKTVNYWVETEIIDYYDRDIYEYGFELILSSAINIIAVIITGIFVKRLIESIVLLVVVIPLQSCGGGYHAKTHLRCFLIMYIGWWSVIQIIPYITPEYSVFIAIVSVATIFILAPVRHENVPMSNKQFCKMRLLVRCFSIGIAVTGIFLSWYVGDNNIGNSIIIGMCVVALSMFAAKISTKLAHL